MPEIKYILYKILEYNKYNKYRPYVRGKIKILFMTRVMGFEKKDMVRIDTTMLKIETGHL